MVGQFCDLREVILFNICGVTKTAVKDSSLSGSDSVMLGEWFVTLRRIMVPLSSRVEKSKKNG